MAAGASAQRAPDTLAKIKAAKSINVAFSGDSLPFSFVAEGIALLATGAVDAFAGDKIKLIGLAAQAKEPDKFAMLTEDLSYEPYAFALPRGDSAMRLEVNKALTKVYVSGDIEGIFAQWLGKLGRPSGLLAAMYLLNAIPE